MRLRRDTRGEIGVFEDLQTLLVVVVSIAILLGSTLYNWSALSSTEQDQDLYDEAEHIVKQVESWDRLQAINSYGSPYPDFMLRQPELVTLLGNDQFEEEIRSDLHYRVTFDDTAVPHGQHDPGAGLYSTYVFGKEPPAKGDVVALQVRYALVMEVHLGPQEYDVSERHPCLMTVEVWR
jgi:type II secretory pathway pseudopilin PulG